RLGETASLAPVFATTGPPGQVSLTRDGVVARFEIPARTAVVFRRSDR
ncbi:hypothetical protein HF635_12170, partial [Weissella cibaria]|nr:hypothetical protein [Weissella cibaria]